MLIPLVVFPLLALSMVLGCSLYAIVSRVSSPFLSSPLYLAGEWKTGKVVIGQLFDLVAFQM